MSALYLYTKLNLIYKTYLSMVTAKSFGPIAAMSGAGFPFASLTPNLLIIVWSCLTSAESGHHIRT